MRKQKTTAEILEAVGKDWERTSEARIKELQTTLMNVVPDGCKEKPNAKK